MKIKENWYNVLFAFLLTVITIVLIFVADTLSISYKEALNVLDNNSLLTYLTKFTLLIFGQNDIALRLPFIAFYVMSVILMYLLTQDYFKRTLDRLINITIFMLLPGLVSASLLVNSAIVVTTCTLFYLYYYKRYEKHNYYLLFIYLLVDNSFAILFLALFFYALNKKENRLVIISLILFTLSMYIYGFHEVSAGKPRGYLLDTFAIYASIFSPLLFIYFFYSMYRTGIKGNRSLDWYISITALVFSLLFSFRQKIYIEDFAPYVVIALPMMVKLFFNSLRVRLPQFRKNHHFLASVVGVILILNVSIIFFNKPLYLFLDKPQKHFVYKYHFAKEISMILKEHNINDIYSNSGTLLKRLEFYGIQSGDKYYVSLIEPRMYTEKYAIKYQNKEILHIYVQRKKF